MDISFTSPHQNSVGISHLPCMCYMSLPSHSPKIWSLKHVVRSTNNKDSYYTVFSILLLPHTSYARVSTSAPYSWTPSAYVLPWMQGTKSHIYTKQEFNHEKCQPRWVVSWLEIQTQHLPNGSQKYSSHSVILTMRGGGVFCITWESWINEGETLCYR